MSNDSLLGVQLNEYRLEALLGQGGMARVYRGLDTLLNRYAAIKVIDTPFRTDAEYVKRFQIEAQAIARLDHPHIVRLYRYGEVDGMLYMAMQFIEGADLAFVLESYRLDGEYIPAEDALRLIKDIAQALDYIHAHGIIHRDIKPSNIMLTGDDASAVITDFGLALRAEIGTQGEVFGSPHYIAPEQAVSSARAVPQSDLYALGVMLFEMFTGTLPFNAPVAMDVAVMHISNPPPSPRSLRPDLTPEVEAVILKALEKKPEDRYQSGRALALALERALRIQSDPAAPTGRTVPERVTIGLAANRPPVLPPMPAAVTPAKIVEEKPAPAPQTPAAEAETAPPAAPAEEQAAPPPAAGVTQVRPAQVSSAVEVPAQAPKPAAPRAQNPPPRAQDVPPTVRLTPPSENKRPRWLLWGIGGLVGLCLLACLGAGAAAVLMRGNNQAAETGPNPVAAAGEETSERPTLTPTTAPTEKQAPTRTPTTPAPAAAVEEDGSYELKFWRCGADSCLIIENSGAAAFPIAKLEMSSKDGQMSGAEWKINILQSGQCVMVIKKEGKASPPPDEVDCKYASATLERDKKNRFWSKTFTVEFQGKEVASCKEDATLCTIRIPQ